MAKVENAGEFRLKSFKITSQSGITIDVSNMIHTYTIQESMSLNSIRGHAKMYDSTGLYYKLPLAGEEILEIEYTDYFGETRKDKFLIYGVNGLKPAKESDTNVLEMTLHFVSYSKYLSDRKYIRKSYTGLVSTIASNIYDEFYSDETGSSEKEFRAETTTGFQRLSIPNYSPEESMNFLARRAYSSEDESSMIRFFENRDGFFFVSPGFYAREVAEDVITFEYNSYPDQTPEGQLAIMNNLISIDFNESVNTIDDMKNGNYNASTVELDILTRKVDQNQYRYMDEYDKYYYPESVQTKSRHTKEFMNASTPDAKTTVIMKDYGDPNDSQYPSQRPNTYDSKAINHKRGSYHHYNSNSINVRIYGRNKIVAGSLIELNIMQFMKDSNSVVKDREYSGTYYVESVESVFFETTFTQNLVISKSGVTGVPETATPDYDLDETNAQIDIPIPDNFVGPQ